MNKLLLLASISLVFGTTYASADWINPPRKACTKNGGHLAQGGVCEANWSSAKRICRVAGGRLPTINELRKVITSCGGEVNDNSNNKNDPSYQSCYANRGFSSSGYYWSSTTLASDSSYAWIVYFKSGNDNVDKSDSYFVRCVRAGQ